MSNSVSQTLVNFSRHSRSVFNHVERCRRNRSLGDGLRHQKEIESFAQSHRVVNQSAGLWIFIRVLQEKSAIDTFRNDNVRNARIIRLLGGLRDRSARLLKGEKRDRSENGQ
jgi:hypothetical protein